MKININDSVTVKLTEAGEKRLRDYFTKIPDLNISQDKVFKAQLWELMNIFGPEMYMGNPDSMFEGDIFYDACQFRRGEDEPLRSS